MEILLAINGLWYVSNEFYNHCSNNDMHLNLLNTYTDRPLYTIYKNPYVATYVAIYRKGALTI